MISEKKTRFGRVATLVLGMFGLVFTSCMSTSPKTPADAAPADSAIDVTAADRNRLDSGVDLGHDLSHDTSLDSAPDSFLHPDASGEACTLDAGNIFPPNHCPCGEVCESGKCVVALNAEGKSCAQLESEWDSLYEQARTCDPLGTTQCTDTVASYHYCCGGGALNAGQGALKVQLEAIVTAFEQLGCNGCHVGINCQCAAPNPHCSSSGRCEL